MVLSSRKFWVTVITLVIILVGSVVPGWSIDADKVADLALIMVPFVVGMAIDPGRGFAGLLQSRKFWAAAVGMAVLVLNSFGQMLPFDISPDQMTGICVTLGAYISAVALEGKYQNEIKQILNSVK